MVESKSGYGVIIFSIILVVFMILFVPWATVVLGKTIGYVVSNLVYWFVFCVPMIAFYAKGSWSNIKVLYSKNCGDTRAILYNAAAFLPVLATGFLVFIPTIREAPVMVVVFAFIYAVVNGTIEELFWRGIYNKLFTKIGMAYIVPTILFSLWHIALALAKGMVYHGGALALLGGAAFMGVLWGIIAYNTKSIRYTTIAHILTNFFAFSGLIYENWFV